MKLFEFFWGCLKPGFSDVPESVVIILCGYAVFSGKIINNINGYMQRHDNLVLVLDYSRWCVRFTPQSVQKNFESKVRIHIYMLDEINNIYFRTKNPNLDYNLD